MQTIKSRLSMDRTNSECALSSKAAEDRRTPRRWRVGHSRSNFRQVLECARLVVLWRFGNRGEPSASARGLTQTLPRGPQVSLRKRWKLNLEQGDLWPAIEAHVE